MDDDEAPRVVSFSDAFELATAQVFALIVSACAGVCVGVAWFSAVGVDGYEIAIPFDGLLAAGLSGTALALSVATVGRFQIFWDDAGAHTFILAGLLQVFVSGLVGIASGLALTGWSVDVVTPLQTIIVWSGNGLMIGAALQAATALVALVMWRAGKALPGFIDE